MVQRVNDPACLCGGSSSILDPEQWVKDPALPQLWHRSQLLLRFDPWPGNFHMMWVQPKKEKKKAIIKKTITRVREHVEKLKPSSIVGRDVKQ